MLNSKFGFRQAANVAAVEGVHQSNSQANPSNSNSTNESYVIAKYDYQSQGPQELSIKKGDRLALIDDTRHWWRVINTQGVTGFVPSNYVKREKQSLFDSIKRGIRANTKSRKTNVNPVTANLIDTKESDLNHNLKQKKVNSDKKTPSHSDILVKELGSSFNGTRPSAPASHSYHTERDSIIDADCDEISSKHLGSSIAIAKYNYKSQQIDELSLTKGDRISVLEKSDDGWWRGILKGQSGWFPSNYVTETCNQQGADERNSSTRTNQVNSITSNMNNSSGNSTHNNINIINQGNNPFNINNTSVEQKENLSNNNNNYDALFVVVALYSFQSQNNEELSFSKDERLDIIEKPAHDPDWWRACNQLGEVGLVPKNYVQILPNVRSIHSWSNKSPTKRVAGDSPTKTSQHNNVNNSNNTRQEQINTSNDMMNEDEMISSQTFHQQQSQTHNNINNSSTMSTSQLAQLAQDLEIKLRLNDNIWYHGVMSRQQCDQLLNAHAEDGDFMIRNSETNAGDFSVSLKAPIRNKHFRVHYIDDCFCIGQRKFNSLEELVEHYKRTPIYTTPSGEKMFLKRPFAR